MESGSGASWALAASLANSAGGKRTRSPRSLLALNSTLAPLNSLHTLPCRNSRARTMGALGTTTCSVTPSNGLGSIGGGGCWQPTSAISPKTALIKAANHRRQFSRKETAHELAWHSGCIVRVSSTRIRSECMIRSPHCIVCCPAIDEGVHVAGDIDLSQRLQNRGFHLRGRHMKLSLVVAQGVHVGKIIPIPVAQF